MEITLDNKNQSAQDLPSSIAMTVTLVTFSMLFLTLFMVYSVFRLNSPTWPPMGMDEVSLFLPIISTVLIALSSLGYESFRSKIKNADYKERNLSLLLTIFMGLGFMLTQIFFWRDLKAAGFMVEDGIFPSMLYGFTWIHAAHIVGALIALIWLQRKIKQYPGPDGSVPIAVVNVGKFWHFLGIIWGIMFVILFLI